MVDQGKGGRERGEEEVENGEAQVWKETQVISNRCYSDHRVLFTFTNSFPYSSGAAGDVRVGRVWEEAEGRYKKEG